MNALGMVEHSASKQRSKLRALKIEERADNDGDYDRVDDVHVQNVRLSEEGANVDEKNQERAEDGEGGNQYRDPASEFQRAGEVAEPLAEADGIEFLHHHRLPDQFHDRGEEEQRGEGGAKGPNHDRLGLGDGGCDIGHGLNLSKLMPEQPVGLADGSARWYR
jgi:hypothetical protein